MIEVNIHGIPAPQGSKRHVGGGRMVESSKKVGPWRKAVAAAAREAAEAPLEGPVAVRVAFVLPRPTSERKRSTRPHTRRPDLDKLLRSTLDGLTGITFLDDSQVTSLAATKRTAQPGEPPGAHVVIAPDAAGVTLTIAA